MINTNMIVRKPWGAEYLAFRNEHMAIWVLEIEKGKATSLHCHPRKNTALIILQGIVEVSFIRDTVPHRFRGLDKVNIFQGRFHRTRAVSDDVVLLEVESPDDKRDIVRLEDDYGRANSPIEEATEPLKLDCLQIIETDLIGDRFCTHFSGCLISILRASDTTRAMGPQRLDGNIYVTLSGGLEHGLVPPGDAIDGVTLSRLTQSFKPVPGTSFLHIWKL